MDPLRRSLSKIEPSASAATPLGCTSFSTPLICEPAVLMRQISDPSSAESPTNCPDASATATKPLGVIAHATGDWKPPLCHANVPANSLEDGTGDGTGAGLCCKRIAAAMMFFNRLTTITTRSLVR